MTEQTDISVVIVTYQNENEITACLESLLNELKNYTYQIIVIDNNSQDQTKQCLADFKKIGTIQIIFNEKNLGFTKAINQGLRESNGNFILTLNPDTVLQSECLGVLLNTLNENTNVGVVAPQLRNSDGSIQRSCRRFPKRRDVLFHLSGLSYLFRNSRLFNGWKMGDFDHLAKRSVDQPQGAFLLFRREVLRETGLWDERFPMFFSDVDWSKRVKKCGYEILFEPAATVVHRQGVSVFKSRATMIWSSHLSFYRYFKKHERDLKLLNELIGVILILSAFLRSIWILLFSGRPTGK